MTTKQILTAPSVELRGLENLMLVEEETPAKTLTTKQLLFVNEYLLDLNATQAAIRAGYSKKTAYRTGADNLRKPQIQVEIQKAIDDRMERLRIDADMVLKRLIEIDEMDIADLLDRAGYFKPVQEWPKTWRTTVSGLVVHEFVASDLHAVVKKIKWPDKLRNLEMIGRHASVQAFSSRMGLNRNSSASMRRVTKQMPPEESAQLYKVQIKRVVVDG